MIKEPPVGKSRGRLPLTTNHNKLSLSRRTLMLVGFSVPIVLVLIAGSVFAYTRLGSHAATLNQNCTLIVPPNPLTAQGLATPYQMQATDPAQGPCNEGNAGQAAFVQGAVIDPATGAISIYNPLIVDAGTQPAVAPVVPQLPRNGIVALWFGSNAGVLTLKDNAGSLTQGRCVNGAPGRGPFGQFSYCNAAAFFAMANFRIRTGQLQVPALGTAKDGQPCPTVRDFSVVDMDQSDNVTTRYLVTGNGQIAQLNAANVQALQGAQTQTNASDNRLLDVALDGALGCTPWMAPDLADPGQMVPALPLNELQAAAHQAAPVATVPANDPMVVVNNQPNLAQLDAYRLGVDQPLVASLNAASTTTYCTNLVNIAPARFMLDKPMTAARPSPDPNAANNLFTFLAQRFSATFGANGLNCAGLLNMPDPVTVTLDGNGVAIDATIKVPTPTGGTTGGALNCSVDGTAVANCTGTTMINGEPCRMLENRLGTRVFVFCLRNRQDRAQAQNNQPPAAQQMNPQQINAAQADQAVNNQNNQNQQQNNQNNQQQNNQNNQNNQQQNNQNQQQNNQNMAKTVTCFVNWTAVNNCTGTAMVSAKPVTLALDQATNTVTFTSATAVNQPANPTPAANGGNQQNNQQQNNQNNQNNQQQNNQNNPTPAANGGNQQNNQNNQNNQQTNPTPTTTVGGNQQANPTPTTTAGGNQQTNPAPKTNPAPTTVTGN